MDFTKNTNLSIEEISENKTSGNELSVTKISDSTAEKTFTNNAFSHFVTDTMTILWEPADSGCRLLRCFGNSPILNVPDMIDGRTVSEMGAYCFSRSRPRFPEKRLPACRVVPRAANRNEHDCRWQSYLYYGGTPKA